MWLIKTFSDGRRLYAFTKDGIPNKAKPVLHNIGDDSLLANGIPTTTKKCCTLSEQLRQWHPLRRLRLVTQQFPDLVGLVLSGWIYCLCQDIALSRDVAVRWKCA